MPQIQLDTDIYWDDELSFLDQTEAAKSWIRESFVMALAIDPSVKRLEIGKHQLVPIGNSSYYHSHIERNGISIKVNGNYKSASTVFTITTVL